MEIGGSIKQWHAEQSGSVLGRFFGVVSHPQEGQMYFTFI